MINALEKRQFNGKNLKNFTIQEVFYEGAMRGIEDIVGKFHEHPAITSWEYAEGLNLSWRFDEPKKMVFPFLVSQADQGDLGEAKKRVIYDQDPDFRKAIDDAMTTAPLAGMRRARFFERTKIAIKTLNDVMITGEWMQEPGIIIASYLLGESEGINVMKIIMQECAKQVKHDKEV